LSGVGELSLARQPGTAGKRRTGGNVVGDVERSTSSTREDFISRCTSLSLVVWRGATVFSEVAGADRVHSSVFLEDAHDPLDSVARPSVAAGPRRN